MSRSSLRLLLALTRWQSVPALWNRVQHDRYLNVVICWKASWDAASRQEREACMKVVRVHGAL